MLHIMKLIQLLTAVGLSEIEAKVYMDLLEYGTQTISSISRTSKLHRPSIYRALPTLQEKGLINQRKVGKLIHYAAEPPEKLRTLLDAIHGELDTMIPQLMHMRDTATPIVKRLDGIAGVQAVYDDILRTVHKGDTLYRYSALQTADLEKKMQPKDFLQSCATYHIEQLIITNEHIAKKQKPSLDQTYKSISSDICDFNSNVSQIIYRNKIAYIDYNQPIAIIIENPSLATMQKDIFRLLYKTLPRL